jgi:ectoine hydroxylase-related dioxygenase (phytanoyl-CoA dioxygenase family)
MAVVDDPAWLYRAIAYRDLGGTSGLYEDALNVFPPDAPIELLGECLRKDGYVILKQMRTHDFLKDLLYQIEPYLKTAEGDLENSFMGSRTKRFGRLLHRIPKSRDLVQDPTLLSLIGPSLMKFSPTLQIHFTSVMHVMEGQSAQVLHRDISPFPNPSPPVVMATMWAATDFTRENGATVLVPGSHLWPDDRVPTKEELRCAEMPAGSVLLYCGNLIHGAGSCKKGFRTGVSLQYCVGWMRQEENQYLAVPLEEARTFPESLQRLMGYDLASRHWGYVDQQHPMNFLNQTDRFGGLDPAGYEMPGRTVALHAIPFGLHHPQRYPVTLDDEK